MLEKLGGIHGDVLVQALPYFFRQPLGRGREPSGRPVVEQVRCPQVGLESRKISCSSCNTASS